MFARINSGWSQSLLATASFLAGTSSAANEPNADILAERFGVRQTVLHISLSPAGDKVAFVSPGPSGSEVVKVIDLKGDLAVKPLLDNAGQTADITRCDWANEERLVCRIQGVSAGSGLLIGFSRLVSVDIATGDTVVLTPGTNLRSLGGRQDGGTVLALDIPGDDDRILMTTTYIREATLGTSLANDAHGLGVDMVDVTNGRRRKVENPDPGAIAYYADETGEVRMKARQPDTSSGNLGARVLYFYRDKVGGRWRLLSQVAVDAQTRDGFLPVAIDGSRNVAYGFASINGFDAVVEAPLAENGTAKVLLSRDDVDVDELIRIGRQRRVVGASYATEKRTIEYFDADLSRLATMLQQALPGKPLINIVGANALEDKLLIIASSDTDPGMVYLYDRKSRELNELLPIRDFLAEQSMGEMRPITFPARDGTRIPGYLTLPPGSDGRGLPAVVLPHGGPSARDEWGFDWLVQFLVARGYAVLQPNYRGSAGYGNAWFGRNGFQAWETAIGDVNDAGRWLVEEGIAKPGSLGVVGWSYGGYAALQSQVLDPSLYKAVVAIAPVSDLEQLRQDSRDYTDFGLVDAFIGQGPHVRSGSPAQHAARFSAPVLLFHGTLDQNVSVRHSRLMEDRLEDAGKPVEYVEYDGLDHGLSESVSRVDMLKRIDAFLGRNVPR